MNTHVTRMFWVAMLGCVMVAPVLMAHSHKQDGLVLRVKTEIVSLGVTVTGQDGAPLIGLQREDFEIYEEKVRQEVEFFSDADDPAAIGVVFDHSGSMRLRMEQARAALKEFVQLSHPRDEYFLLSFNERATKPMEVSDGEELLRRLHVLKPEGDTALYDAVYRALERLRESRQRKRALLIISDGVDNQSRYNMRELRQQLREADVKIYVIGSREISSTCGRLCQFEASAKLESLAEMTGGKAFFPPSYESLEKAVSQIAVELRRQYSIGYVPANTSAENGWRRITVRVKDKKKVSVRAREGYYATSNERP